VETWNKQTNETAIRYCNTAPASIGSFAIWRLTSSPIRWLLLQ
jgi:hypothetical protein